MARLTRRSVLAGTVPVLGAGALALRGGGAQAAPAATARHARRPRRRRRRARRLPRRRGRPSPQRLRPPRGPARLRLGHDDAGSRTAASLREWTLVAGRKEVEVAPGVSLRGLVLQRPHPRADAARPRGRAAAGDARQRDRPPAHDPLPRAPRRADGRRPRRRRGQGRRRASGRSTSSTPSRSALHLYHCHVRPLAEHIAKGLYGAFVIDPREGAARGRRARDGHERVRHELRPRERAVRRQLASASPTWSGRSRSRAASSCGSTSSTCSSTTSSTRSTSTATSSTTSRRARR